MALSHFPVALLLTATGFDVLTFGGLDLGSAARYTMIAGLCAALPTAITGIGDWLRMGSDERARAVAERHIALVGTAVVMFAIAAWLREDHSLSSVVVADLVGAGFLAAGAWHGGELVLRHRVGVSRETEDEPRVTDEEPRTSDLS